MYFPGTNKPQNVSYQLNTKGINLLINLYRVFLQKIRVSTQIIALIGLVMAVIGYLLATDWQAIPYDPCTEYSPFHHPELYENLTLAKNRTKEKLELTKRKFLSLNLLSNIGLKFGDGQTAEPMVPIEVDFPYVYECFEDVTCPVCKAREDFFSQLCLIISRDRNGKVQLHEQQPSINNEPMLLSCSLTSEQKFCVNFYNYQEDKEKEFDGILQNLTAKASASIQNLMVLPDNVYDVASTTCMNAINGQCHWIPFSTLTREKCMDCPPICRSKQQTLSFAQFIMGLAILIATNPFVWVPTVAMATNQTPKNLQVSANVDT